MKERKKETISGLFLIGIGLLVFLGQFVSIPDIGLLFLPFLGGIFLIWGIITREGGLMIPGGILSGIGWGVVAMSANLARVNDENEGGVFLIVFGLGFASITLLSWLFTDETHWWALIPGGILATIGVAVLTNGILLNVLSLVGNYWPVVLILLGIYVIYRAIRSHDEPEDKYEKFMDENYN